MNIAQLQQLPEPDLRTKHARQAQDYMSNKGIDARPFAVATSGDASYFYYQVPNPKVAGALDLLELEVYFDGDAWRRTVSCFRPDAR